MGKTKIAFIYDFDKTLSPKDMQEYSFIPGLGIKPKEFWGNVSEEVKKQKADNIVTYMCLMIEKAISFKKEKLLKKNNLKALGKNIKLFSGVNEWFDNINEYAKKIDVKIEHYIISAGNKEIIEGTSIAKKFKKIYGCSFRYDDNDIAKTPGLVINYTNKTQFIFRINKGLLDEEDNSEINKFMHEDKRSIPFSNMVYFGDGDTDIPCMKLVKEKGGYSIAVYPKSKKGAKKKTQELIKDNRVNFIFPADYEKTKNIFKTCKIIINQMKNKSILRKMELEQKKQTNPNPTTSND